MDAAIAFVDILEGNPSRHTSRQVIGILVSALFRPFVEVHSLYCLGFIAETSAQRLAQPGIQHPVHGHRIVQVLIPRPTPVIGIAGCHVHDPSRKLETVDSLASRMQIHHVIDEPIALIWSEQAFEYGVSILLILGFLGRC